ncbi:phenylalanine--tRNA ligase subunit beta [Candidatus Falkowbacteria bacterium CG1_02_37_21]|nr:MAG: phenylalanine--tRNA ligase subunit beta [Candidatus Falkowbacteria bacterium CG1_02_37_21]
MYISLNWLKEFIKIPAKISAEIIATELTQHTVEVEAFVNQAERFDKVVVGKVLEVNPHSNADRLRLTVVDVQSEKLNIVCGAPNVAVGQLVPVALSGAVLPDGTEIKATEIRGEQSNGMLCAEDELGLGQNHEGIMVLSVGTKVGMPFAKYLKTADVILEVDNKSLSNRPDLLCHYGLARELSVIFDIDLKPYDKFLNKFDLSISKDKSLSVKVEDQKLCPRYQALKIENIVVKESPAWLKERLIAAQQRPVNNIVDLTNYIMLEIGQPMHAFDADKVKKITVRPARVNEIIETLDGQERTLNTDDLVIAVDKEAVAIAGIMGGQESGVSSETTSIVLEAANFQAASVRRTSQRLGLRSESSLRFEKSLDPALTEIAIRRFLTLLKKLCPEFKIGGNLIDIKGAENEVLVIDLDLFWLEKKIGQPIPRDEVINILKKLGFTVTEVTTKKDSIDILSVTVPSWRATKDVNIKEDLAEEILRFYGYDNVVSRLPLEILRTPESNQRLILERKIKNILSLRASLMETYNYSFVGVDQLTKLHVDFSHYLKVVNPLSEIHTHLRQSLIPGLVANIKSNQAKADSLAFFEIGSVFFDSAGNLPKETGGEESLPYQEKRLAFVLADENDNLLGRLKGVVNMLLQSLLGFNTEVEFIEVDNIPGWATAGISAKIITMGHDIGLVTMVSPAATAAVNLKKPIALAEINFDLLFDLVLAQPNLKFSGVLKYPPLTRDLAIVVSEEILYNKVRKAIKDFDALIKSVELFDVYSGDKLESGKKSLAWHLVYQSEDKTLTSNEVDNLQNKLLEYLAENLGAKLRDF